jgi:glutathione S-transferase
MLRIWGRKTSSNVQKVLWTCGELNLPFERIDVTGEYGATKEPTYLAMNPNGLVPTIEDKGRTLWESNTITRYLAREYGQGTLEPADPIERARASQWMDWHLSILGPAITPVFWATYRQKPEQRDQKAIDAAKARTIAAMTILDNQLKQTQYVAGDTFSCGDIPVGIMAYRYRQIVPERPQHNGLERWYALIEKRPAFHEHIGSLPLV